MKVLTSTHERSVPRTHTTNPASNLRGATIHHLILISWDSFWSWIERCCVFTVSGMTGTACLERWNPMWVSWLLQNTFFLTTVFPLHWGWPAAPCPTPVHPPISMIHTLWCPSPPPDFKSSSVFLSSATFHFTHATIEIIYFFLVWNVIKFRSFIITLLTILSRSERYIVRMMVVTHSLSLSNVKDFPRTEIALNVRVTQYILYIYLKFVIFKSDGSFK